MLKPLYSTTPAVAQRAASRPAPTSAIARAITQAEDLQAAAILLDAGDTIGLAERFGRSRDPLLQSFGAAAGDAICGLGREVRLSAFALELWAFDPLQRRIVRAVLGAFFGPAARDE